MKIKARHRKSLKVVELYYDNIEDAKQHNKNLTDFEIMEL